MEGGERGLIQDTIPTFSWRDCEKPQSGQRSPGRDFNPGPPEHDVGELTTQLRIFNSTI